MKRILDQGALSLNNDEALIISLAELDLFNVRSEQIISSFVNFKKVSPSKSILCKFETWAAFNVCLSRDGEVCEIKYYEDVTRWDYDNYVVRSVNSVLEHFRHNNFKGYLDLIDISNLYFELDIVQDNVAKKYMTTSK